MDIAKYIGQYLLKNKFCYIHGLGNMELLKRSANYDGKALAAPYYEVVVTMGGSIDDNLANFIATNEQISISKAANALREYSMQSRKDMQAGKEVPIPGIGKFTEEKGRVKFVTDDNFRYVPAGIPTIKNSRQLEEQNAKPAHKPSFPAPHKADSVNWSMVILAAVLVLIIGGGAYGIYYYTHKDKVAEATAAVPPADTVAQAPRPVVADTVAHKDSTAVTAAPVADSLQVNPYRLVIGDYPTRAKAEKRQGNLKQNGYSMDVLPKDSSNYLVVTTINCRSRDTTHVIDSLRRLFGYKGVAVLK